MALPSFAPSVRSDPTLATQVHPRKGKRDAGSISRKTARLHDGPASSGGEARRGSPLFDRRRSGYPERRGPPFSVSCSGRVPRWLWSESRSSCPSPKLHPVGKWLIDQLWIMPRANRSRRRSPCLHGVDPGDNSTVFGRSRFRSCSPARGSRGSGSDRGTRRASLESDASGVGHCERLPGQLGAAPPAVTVPPAVGRLRSLCRGPMPASRP